MTQGSSALTEPANARRVANSLMRMALALLDRTNEPLAAIRLQHALDTLAKRKPGAPTEAELDAFLDD